MDETIGIAGAHLVSIVMPAYNAAAHIAESIESVLVQTYTHWELLIVDDGSTDATRLIIEKFCREDSRIKYFYQENARQSSARNNAIARASGKYIAFLDADDLWLPAKLAVQLPVLLGNQADLVFAEAYAFQDTFDEQHSLRCMGAGTGIFRGEVGLSKFLLYNRIPILTVLVTKNALASVGNFIENPLVAKAEDYHLWLKLLLAGYTLRGLPDVLGAYREHAASISNADRLGLRYVVEAKANLINSYPQYQNILLASMHRTMLHSLETLGVLTDKEYYTTLNRFLQLRGRLILQPIFTTLRLLNSRRLALKTAYFILNYI